MKYNKEEICRLYSEGNTLENIKNIIGCSTSYASLVIREYGLSTKPRQTHGKRNTTTYRIWAGMVNRCHNPNNKNYSDYGGKGIFVCEEWKTSFEAFYRSMGEAPRGKSIDRIDGTKGYSPENCRWANTIEQNRNRVNSKTVTYMGTEKPLVEWCKELGLKYATTWRRLYRQGKSFDQCLKADICQQNSVN